MSKADRIARAREAIDHLTEGHDERDRLLAALTAIVDAIEPDPPERHGEFRSDGLRDPLLKVR